jgi:hypothetical protein
LDRTGKVLECPPPKPIGKFTFSCFTNLKEKQLEKLVKGSLEKKNSIFHEPLAKGGGKLNLKSMYEFTRQLCFKSNGLWMDRALPIPLMYQGCLNEMWGVNKGGCGKKKKLCFGANGAFFFQVEENTNHKASKRCLGTLFSGCPLCYS